MTARYSKHLTNDPMFTLPASAIAAVPRRGHAGTPGRGPKDETCGSCHHALPTGARTTFYKCDLSRHRMTHGAATDIKLKDPACEKWEAKRPAQSGLNTK